MKTVISMTGISRPTLVAWERRYGFLELRRDESGYRVYTQEDIALLRKLKALVDSGLAISEAIRVVQGQSPVSRAPRARATLLQSLLAFDRAAADVHARELELLPFERALDEAYLPLLREVGDLWHDGDITIAQEHFATGFCEEQLMGMFHRLGAGPEGGIPVACTTLPGDKHQLALLSVAIRLALRGCRVTWLAGELPIDELQGYIAAQRPKLLCLSSVALRPEGELLELVEQVRGAGAPDTVIAVGGPGVAGLEDRTTARCWYCPDLASFWPRWNAALADGRITA